MLGEKKRYKMVSRKRNVTNQMFVKRRIVRLTFGRSTGTTHASRDA